MSFFADFVGSAANAGAGLLNDQIKSNRETDARRLLQQQESDLIMQRAKALDEFKRSQSAQDGAAIQGDSDQMRIKRIQELVNQREGSSMSAEDAQTIANNPEAIKAYGLRDRTRSETYDDMAASAEKRGLIGQMKDIRGQQDLERQRTRDDNRDEDAKAQNATNNKRIDTQNEISNRRLDQEAEFRKMDADIRNRLAGAAEARAGRSDKRAEANMDKAELQSTRLSLTSVMQDISKEADRIQVLRSTAMDDKTMALYDGQLAKLRESQTVARGRLNELAGVAPEVKEKPPTWNDLTGDVSVNERVIGKAKSPAEAKALIAKSGAAPEERKPSENKPVESKPGLISATSQDGAPKPKRDFYADRAEIAKAERAKEDAAEKAAIEKDRIHQEKLREWRRNNPPGGSGKTLLTDARIQ